MEKFPATFITILTLRPINQIRNINMKNQLILLIVLLLACFDSSAQRKLLERLKGSSDSSSNRKGYTIALPAIGYSQETGWQFGAASLTSFYTSKTDTSTRNSNIAGLISFTTKSQSHFAVKPDIWSKGNAYHFTADLKYKNFPFNFYGIGDRTNKADEDIITQKLIRVAGEAEKRLKRNIYAGVTLNYEHYTYQEKDEAGIYASSPAVFDRDGGQVLFVGLSQITDSRNTNNYTTKGTYLKLNLSYAPDFFRGDNYSGALFRLDFRNFSSLNNKAVLGFNVNYQTLQGSKVPFYLLPQLGNDQIMRGYYTGRYRDQNLLALQTEFRYRFIRRLGLAAFLGTGSVYGGKGFRINDFKPSYGGGLRYFVSPERGTTLRLDYGFGEKRPGEKLQKGFYLSFGEAF